MAKYNVTYTCGHTGIVQLCGPTSERNRRIDWLEKNQVCPACYQAAQAAARAAQNQAAAKSNIESGRPELVGSPRQIAWAETIRAGKLADAGRIIERATAQRDAGESREKIDAAEIAIEIARDWQAQTSASWWIDHREAMLEATIRSRYARLQSVI